MAKHKLNHTYTKAILKFLEKYKEHRFNTIQAYL